MMSLRALVLQSKVGGVGTYQTARVYFCMQKRAAPGNTYLRMLTQTNRDTDHPARRPRLRLSTSGLLPNRYMRAESSWFHVMPFPIPGRCSVRRSVLPPACDPMAIALPPSLPRTCRAKLRVRPTLLVSAKKAAQMCLLLPSIWL